MAVRQSSHCVALSEKSGEGSARGRRQLIVGMSANIDLHTRQQALLCGMDDFLPKPFSVDAMIAVVRSKLPSSLWNDDPAAAVDLAYSIDFEQDMYDVYAVTEGFHGSGSVARESMEYRFV